MISIDTVKKLRDRTGISIMQCKKALEEVDGDVEKAIVMLRKNAAKVAEKKSGRKLGAGVVQAYIHTNNTIGSMIELSCETDFVSKNEEFVTLARDIAMHAAATDPISIDRSGIEESKVEAAQSVFEDESKDKPNEIRQKIIEGKMDSYYKDIVLLEQSFIKDQEKTIKDLIEEAIQKFGEKVEITRFVRFSL
mgnify:CR=1 FL=1